jgi:hypothetical protein
VWDEIVGRFITSFLVERHIRTRLAYITKAYEQLQALSVSDAEHQSWLEKTCTNLKRVISGLPTLRLPSVIAISPIVLGLVATVRHVHVHVHHPYLLVIWLVFYIGLYITFPLSLAFNEKQHMFAETMPESELSRQPASVYLLEREHFVLLHRAKPREIQLDVLLPAILLITVGTLTLEIGLLHSYPNYPYIGVGVALIVLACFLTPVWFRMLRTR